MRYNEACYNEAVRQRKDYKEKLKEAKLLTEKAKRLLLLKVKRGEPTNKLEREKALDARD